MNLLDRVDEVAQPFEREVFALHRHDDAVRAAQAVERQQAQARRAIDQHEVVLGHHPGERSLESPVAPIELDELDLGTRQLAVGAENVVAGLIAATRCFGNRGALEQHVVDAQLELVLVDTRPHRRVTLRIEVDDENAFSDSRQAGSEVDGGGRLADAALLVGNTKNTGHAGDRSHWVVRKRG